VAQKRIRRDDAARQYALEWTADMEEAEKRTNQTKKDIASVFRSMQRDIEEYEIHKSRMRHTQDDQDETLEVGRSILEEKVEVLNEKKKHAVDHGRRIYNMRAQMLHDVLCKVIDEVELATARHYMRICFNRLRIMLLEKKAHFSSNKGRLQQWVGICTNLRRLNNSMPQYRRARMKRVSFTKWINFLDERYRYETPKLSLEVKRRAELVGRLSARVRYEYENRKKNKPTSTSSFKAAKNRRTSRVRPTRNVVRKRTSITRRNRSSLTREGPKAITNNIPIAPKVDVIPLDEAGIVIDPSSRAIAFMRWVEFVQVSVCLLVFIID
jgi:hypothetical protein